MIHQEMRPRNFGELRGQEHVVKNIKKQSASNNWFHVYILEGQFGSGKTSIGRIIAKAANCENRDSEGNPCLCCKSCLQVQKGCTDVIEIDGADKSGVGDIRELKEMVSFLPISLKYKVAIIDEVQKLSDGAFNCLLKMLEEPPKYMIFILCTTKIEAIPSTVRSRAACYHFNRIPHDTIATHIRLVAQKYNLVISTDASNLLADYSMGSMRNALMLLEQAAAYGIEIDEEICKDLLGICEEETLCEVLLAFLNRDLAQLVQHLDLLERSGKSFSLLSSKMVQGCADLIMTKCFSAESLTGTVLYRGFIERLVSQFSLNAFCAMANVLKDLPEKMKEGCGKYEFIVYMVGAFKQLQDYDLPERIAKLEAQIAKYGTMPSVNVEALKIEVKEMPQVAAPREPENAISTISNVIHEAAERPVAITNQGEVVESDDESFVDVDFDSIYNTLNLQIQGGSALTDIGTEEKEEMPVQASHSLKEKFENSLFTDQELYYLYTDFCTVDTAEEKMGWITISSSDLETHRKLLLFIASQGFTWVRVQMQSCRAAM